jgi:hypothetical protein
VNLFIFFNDFFEKKLFIGLPVLPTGLSVLVNFNYCQPTGLSVSVPISKPVIPIGLPILDFSNAIRSGF